MEKLIEKFYDFAFDVKQFLHYHDTQILVLMSALVIVLFALGIKNLALIIALIYIMAKVTK
jgi:hypothetical protein